MFKFRKATWGLIIWTVLMAAWAIGGTMSAASSTDCTGDAAAVGCAIGGGLALTFIGGLWFVGFIVGSLIWLMSRPSRN